MASISDLFLFALIFQSLAFYKSTTVILINTKFPEETAALFTKDLDGWVRLKECIQAITVFLQLFAFFPYNEELKGRIAIH